MPRAVAVSVCGLALAGCSMAMPSLEFFRSAPPTEVLRIESEPPGADARTALGQSCRTPCELTVAAGGDLAVSFELNGYQPQTVQLRADPSSGSGYGEARLQPNPVYAELQPMRGAPPAAKRRTSAPKQVKQQTAPLRAQSAPDPNPASPWPDPPPVR